MLFRSIYSKQSSLLNGRDWWSIRDDQPTPGSDGMASIYWSDSKARWVIEASDITWEAPDDVFNALDDDRHFPGLQEYFGDNTNDWQQISVSEATNGLVSVSIACIDTHFPTKEPTDVPTQQPTEQPTDQKPGDSDETSGSDTHGPPTGKCRYMRGFVRKGVRAWGAPTSDIYKILPVFKKKSAIFKKCSRKNNLKTLVPCKVTGKCGSVRMRLVPAPRGSGLQTFAKNPEKNENQQIRQCF